MKLGTICKYVIDSFIRHIKTNIMIIIFLAVTAVILTRSYFVFYSNRYTDMKIRELYDGNLDMLYTAFLDFEPIDEVEDRIECYKQVAKYNLRKRELFEKINSLDGVRGFGNIPEITGYSEPMVKRIIADEEKIGRCVELDCELVGMRNLKLSGEITVDENYLKSHDEYDEIWLLGSEVKGSEAGSVVIEEDVIHLDDQLEYWESNSEFWHNIYSNTEGLVEDKSKYSQKKVYVDRLEKGSQWFRVQNLYGNSDESIPFELLDDATVIIRMHKGGDGSYGSGSYFIMLEDDANPNECIRKIETLAAEYDCGLTCSPVSSNRAAVNRKKQDLVRLYLEQLAVVIVIGCLLAISIQITNIISDRKVYGVLYANGAYKRDVLIMMVSENIIRTVVGGIVGIYVTYKQYLVDDEVQLIVYKDIIRYSIPYVIIALFVIMFISGIIPYVILRRYEPADLIEGRMG